MTELACHACDHPLDAAGLIERITGRVPATGSYTSSCPHCGTWLEFVVRRQQIEFGYTYWAGSLHFEGVLGCAVPGLREVHRPGGIVLELHGTPLHSPFPDD